MPLERSHVIFICSVSPVLVGLAAYFYWYRKNSQENNIQEEVQTPNLDCAVIPPKDTTDQLVETNLEPNSKPVIDQVEIDIAVTDSPDMTRENQDIAQDAVSRTPPSSPDCPIASISPKEHTETVSSDRSSIQLSTNEQEDLAQSNQSDVLPEDEDDCLGQLTFDSNYSGQSNFSDTHTEVAADSTLNVNLDNIIFKFEFPSDLVGLLIGNHGRNVKLLQEKTGARVRIERSNGSSKFQVCIVEGSATSVDAALELIKERFPKLDLSQLSDDSGLEVGSGPVPIPQLRIPQHTFSDVCISMIVSANNVYLQQPTHPYFRELEVLTQQMNAVYSDFSAPLLPEPIPAGVICAAPWVDQVTYCRALILSVNESSGTCQVKYVDHGSVVELPIFNLRQIRSDFLRLPFQATECYLSNIAPLDGENKFFDEAASYLHKLTEGYVLLCWVTGMSEDGKPMVELNLRNGSEKVSINKLLVENGYAKSVETPKQ